MLKFRIVERAVAINKETGDVITAFYPEYLEDLKNINWINIGSFLKGYSEYFPTEKEALQFIDEFKIRCKVYDYPERIIEVE
jgi:hypothetical protein